MALGGIVCRGGVGPSVTTGLFVTHGLSPGGSNPPPPVNSAIILGLEMVAQGLTILSGLSTNLYKGLVKDELNKITR